MLGLRYSQSHPVADKRIERFAQNDEHGFEPSPNVLCLLRGIKGDRGHGGLLGNLTAMMCRESHRNARRIGAASHRRSIGTPRRRNDVAAISGGPLCRAYERGREVASIFYAVTRI